MIPEEDSQWLVRQISSPPPKTQRLQQIAFFDHVVSSQIGNGTGDFFDAGDAAMGQGEAADGTLKDLHRLIIQTAVGFDLLFGQFAVEIGLVTLFLTDKGFDYLLVHLC